MTGDTAIEPGSAHVCVLCVGPNAPLEVGHFHTHCLWGSDGNGFYDVVLGCVAMLMRRDFRLQGKMWCFWVKYYKCFIPYKKERDRILGLEVVCCYLMDSWYLEKSDTPTPKFIQAKLFRDKTTWCSHSTFSTIQFVFESDFSSLSLKLSNIFIFLFKKIILKPHLQGFPRSDLKVL